MPVNYLMNIESNLPEWLKKTSLQPNQILYLGLRNLDKYEWKLLKNLGIKYYTVDDLRINGIPEIINYYMNKYVYNKNKKIHISIDVDAIDPSLIPSTGTREENGLVTEEVIQLITILKQNTVNYDIVELNPLIGDEVEFTQSLFYTEKIINGIIS